MIQGNCSRLMTFTWLHRFSYAGFGTVGSAYQAVYWMFH